MDNNRTPPAAYGYNGADLYRACNLILDAIENNPSCFWDDIWEANKKREHPFLRECLGAATSKLIHDQVIRLREDSYEHDWEYVIKH